MMHKTSTIFKRGFEKVIGELEIGGSPLAVLLINPAPHISHNDNVPDALVATELPEDLKVCFSNPVDSNARDSMKIEGAVQFNTLAVSSRGRCQEER